MPRAEDAGDPLLLTLAPPSAALGGRGPQRRHV